METIETTKTAADAESFAEYKRIRSGEKVAADPPAPLKEDEGASGQGPVASDKSGSEQDESAEVPETSKANSGDKSGKPKRDRSAEGRISELNARAKRAEEERDALRRKLEELERAARPAAEKSEPAAKPETKLADDDPKPKLKDFLAKAKEGQTYEDVQEEWEEACAAWRDRQRVKEARKAEEERYKATLREKVEGRLNAAKAKYSDFDQVAGALPKLTPAMQQFVVENDSGFDVVYSLGKNVDEFRRIAQLSPANQIAELGWMAKSLGGSASSAPEKPKPAAPVSKAPAPPRSLGGTEAPAAKSTAEAASYAEHKRLRLQRG